MILFLLGFPSNIPDPYLIRRHQWILEDWRFKSVHPQTSTEFVPINVPYPWDWHGSGVFEIGVQKGLYTIDLAYLIKKIEEKDFSSNSNLFVRFGAVFLKSTVEFGELKYSHGDGYTPFVVALGKIEDIRIRADTDSGARENAVLRVLVDSPADLLNFPHGKQRSYPPDDWDDICFSRSSGIWQPVSVFVSGDVLVEFIESVNLNGPYLRIGVKNYSRAAHDGRIEVYFYEFLDVSRFSSAEEVFEALDGRQVLMQAGAKFLLEPGAEAVVSMPLKRKPSQNLRLWSPDKPTLYTLKVRILSEDGRLLDEVISLTGFKKIEVSRGKILLNGKPVYLRGVLDQGYSVEGGYFVPPEVEKKDVQNAKSLGFNLIRYHIKNPSPWYRYWADTIGVLLWIDVPSPGRWSRSSAEAVKGLSFEMLKYLLASPSVSVFSLYNEEWGLNFAVSRVEKIRSFLKRLYSQVKNYAGDSVLVVDNSGWAHVATDLLDFHYYNPDLRRWVEKIKALADGRSQSVDWHPFLLSLECASCERLPLVNSEFGDGYDTFYHSNRFDYLHWHINYFRSVPKIKGYVFTELYDVEMERAGLFYFDRTPKDLGYDLSRLNRECFVVLFPKEPPFDTPEFWVLGGNIAKEDFLEIPYEIVLDGSCKYGSSDLILRVSAEGKVISEKKFSAPFSSSRLASEVKIPFGKIVSLAEKDSFLRIEFSLLCGGREIAWNFVDLKMKESSFGEEK